MHRLYSYSIFYYQTLTAAVRSVEDHGYILDLGIPDVSGFLSFDDAKKGPFKCKLREGWPLDATVTKLSKNQRNCDVSIDQPLFASSHVGITFPFIYP